ncbi:SDR family oxidoreductase [Paralimibaculum aggregatum]|uniref:SDR family oxidoreductase n=1 Tax=Paralimibaculum aggregatum TaxID=3036245 RepID=A0ABQ6LIK6_9RHOB|nr:SDR family oxidoreductase [Limibaculum sp. NKW23]GMG82812.1 SDR family oxidoreductase [Limibaculum sp. NKW23]
MAEPPELPALPALPGLGLAGRRALVTGGGRGIGFAAAAALAGAGAEVVLAARGRQELEAAAGALRAAGHGARAAVLDVTDRAAIARVTGAEGPFHILVNAAGFLRRAGFLETRPEDLDRTLAVNLRGAWDVSQAVAAGMVAAGIRGSIVNVSSQMGLVGGTRRGGYAASKWGLEGATREMALDLARHGIRANTVCPTFTRTAMNAAALADPAFAGPALAGIPLGRFAEPADVAGAILFLASEMSAMVTGTALAVDGGFTAQ